MTSSGGCAARRPGGGPCSLGGIGERHHTADRVSNLFVFCDVETSPCVFIFTVLHHAFTAAHQPTPLTITPRSEFNSLYFFQFTGVIASRDTSGL